MDFIGEQSIGQLVFQFSFEQPFQRAGTVDFVIAVVHNPGIGFRRQLQLNAAVGQTLFYVRQRNGGNRPDIVLGQPFEDNNVVNTIDEFGTERLAQSFQHLFLLLFRRQRRIGQVCRTEV